MGKAHTENGGGNLIGIIGGGLAGLSLAYHLRDSIVIEAKDRVGGLLRSERIEGYTFDTGGSHILFSRDENALRELVNIIGSVVEHRRRTFIFYNGRFIKYPFENGIHMLPKEERFEILYDFFMNYIKRKGKPKNLLEWFYHVFGRAITEKYLKPYNEKLWKTDLRRITLEWVGNRIPNPPVEDILKSCVGIPTEGYKHQLKFYYPLEGGIETLARNLAKRCRVVTGERINKIEREDGVFILKGKREYICDKVVSTIPIDVTAKMLGLNVRLSYNPLTVVGLGGKGDLPDFHWIYVPDKDIVFHRVAFLHNYSPNMAPEGKINIIAEVSGRAEVEDVIEGLEKMGFDIEIDVAMKWEWDYAYIVFDETYEKVEEIRNFLMENGIIPFGRFGNWEYLNMDAVWIKAKELAKVL